MQYYVSDSTMHKMYLLNKLNFALMLQFADGPWTPDSQPATHRPMHSSSTVMAPIKSGVLHPYCERRWPARTVRRHLRFPSPAYRVSSVSHLKQVDVKTWVKPSVCKLHRGRAVVRIEYTHRFSLFFFFKIHLMAAVRKLLWQQLFQKWPWFYCVHIHICSHIQS